MTRDDRTQNTFTRPLTLPNPSHEGRGYGTQRGYTLSPQWERAGMRGI